MPVRSLLKGCVEKREAEVVPGASMREVTGAGSGLAMTTEAVRRLVTRRPGWVVGAWLAAAALVVATAPDLTKLAAEGQAHLVPPGLESARAAKLIREAWPDQWSDALAVVALHRSGG